MCDKYKFSSSKRSYLNEIRVFNLIVGDREYKARNMYYIKLMLSLIRTEKLKVVIVV